MLIFFIEKPLFTKMYHEYFGFRENPFSIASAPSAGREVQFLIKELGDFTATIGQVEPGTRAWLEAPHGHLDRIGGGQAGPAQIVDHLPVAQVGFLIELKENYWYAAHQEHAKNQCLEHNP